MLANAVGCSINGLGGGRKEVGDFGEKWYWQAKSHHNEGSASCFGENLSEVGGYGIGRKEGKKVFGEEVGKIIGTTDRNSSKGVFNPK